MLRPLGGGLDSHYSRQGDDEVWQQQGRHHLRLAPGINVKAISTATITRQGCSHLSLTLEQQHLTAELTELTTIEDLGIPQAQMSLNPL